VVIALGTNDFSEGDGSYDRKPITAERFTDEYVRFIRRVRSRYPGVPVCCLSSPVFSGEKDEQLMSFLSAVKQKTEEDGENAGMHLFRFSRPFTDGCDGHPGRKDHEKMAKELVPFIKKIMQW
jgi:lysophospholipase L1-like esterase